MDSKKLKELLNKYGKFDVLLLDKLNTDTIYYTILSDAVEAAKSLGISDIKTYCRYQFLNQFKNITFDEIESFKRLQIPVYAEEITTELKTYNKRKKLIRRLK